MDFSDNAFGDVEAEAVGFALSRVSLVKHVYLRDNQIGVAGAAVLRAGVERNMTLTKVDLADNACCKSDAGVAHCEAIDAACQVCSSSGIDSCAVFQTRLLGTDPHVDYFRNTC